MGKLQLRLPEAIHNRVRRIAKKEGVSINQLLVNAISNDLVRYETHRFFEEKSKDFDEAAFLAALDEIPDVAPIPEDKM